MPALHEFTTPAALRAFGDTYAAMIRAGSFAATDSELRALIDVAGGPLAALVADLDLETVTIDGWDELYADMTATEGKGHRITATGIDASGHAETDEVGFEVSFYDDHTFPFSATSRDDIAAACTRYGAPWMGCFLDIAMPLRTRGLAPLKHWLAAYPGKHHRPGANVAAPEHFEAYHYGVWLLYVAIHASLAHELATRGLPHPMPVIVGEHDFGPYLAAVYAVDTTCDHQATTERILAARRQQALAAFDSSTDQMVSELRAARDAIRGWQWWHNPGKRRTYIDLRRNVETLLLRRFDIALKRPTWELSDADFQAVVTRLRDARRAQLRP